MSNRMFVLAFFVVGLGVAVASAQSQTNQGVSATHDSLDYSKLNKAPAKVRTRVNPFQNDPSAIVAGQILFEDHCAECHGVAGMGGQKRTQPS
jgi:mono/diheme cytochrome c family protein